MPRSLKEREQTANENFVLQVQKFPCLYNYRLEEYSRRDIVDSAWEQIAVAHGDSVESCKEKWKNIRTVFVRNLKPRPDGNERRIPYYLNKYLKFLTPFIKVQIPDNGSSSNQSLREPEDEEQCYAKIKEDEGRFNVKMEEEQIYDSGEADENDSEEVNDSEHICLQLTNTNNSPNNIMTNRMAHGPESTITDKTKIIRRSNAKSKRKQNLEIESIVEYFEEKKKKLYEPDNHRKLFLLSLLPDIESMNETQFRVFRKNVLDTIDNALEVQHADDY